MTSFYSCTNSFKPLNKVGCLSQIMEDRDRSHVEDLLVTMIEDQSDHQHAKFTESYIKVSKHV
ncbi:hypothetical protein EON65_22760 [archaeon]|nr:MAG: hypothetical protein EON65_22760 [archaeon]